MTQTDPTLPHDSEKTLLDRRLDLLVDGQLDETQRRDLLRSLEQQPDGWRRCALAFLEAQCWQEALGRAGQNAPADDSVALRGTSLPGSEHASGPLAAARAGRSRRSIMGWPAIVLAMAACFFAALGLGMGLRQCWLALRGPVLLRGAVPQPESIAGLGAEQQGPSPAGPAVQPAAPAPAQAAPGPMRWVTLYMPGGTDGEQIAVQLPTLEQDELDAGVWEGGFAQPPKELIEALRRLGIELRQRRELVPLRMPDGHQLVLPVEEVQFHYVGSPAL